MTTAYRWSREGKLPVPMRNRALKALGCARRDTESQAVMQVSEAAASRAAPAGGVGVRS